MNKKEVQIICSGFGGQGILTIGLLLSHMAMDEDRPVTWLPAYGAEMRGGTASCNVKISDHMIASPFIRTPDIVLALNEPAINKYEETITKDGILLVNSSIVGKRTYREELKVYSIDANDLANDIGNSRGAGIVMIGAMMKILPIFDKEQAKKAIEDYFAKKGKVNSLNDACFDIGYEKVVKIN